MPGPLPTFSLTSTTGGDGLPFAIGHLFERSAIPAGSPLSIDLPASQMIALSFWSDGSIRHALIAGLIDLEPNVAKAIAFGGPTATGNPLGEDELEGAGPSASVTFGSAGTVALEELIGTSALKITEHAGPLYVSFQYQKAFPANPDVRAVFHVQLWKGGAYRVRVVVENGRAVQSGASVSGSATVTVGGRTVFSGSVSMPLGTRWDAVGFGASDPQITPLFDATYLRATRVIPNYGFVNVTEARLESLGELEYSPMDLMQWEPNQGVGGFQLPIGLMPHWDACVACTGDARAYRGAIASARAYGTYSIFFRDDATGRIPTFGDHADAKNGEENTESLTGDGSNPYRWEFAHHPNAGFFAWIVTAERFFLDVLQANAFAAWLTESRGEGTNKIYSSQTRGRAWRYRSIACAAAVSPDGDKFKADALANTLSNLRHWHMTRVTTNSPATGIGALYSDNENDPGIQHSIFEHLFLASSVGWSWDFDLWSDEADRATHTAVRDYFYRVPIGISGRGAAAGEYSYRRATGPYRMTIGAGPDTSDLFESWAEIEAATYGDDLDSSDGLSIMESYADDPGDSAFAQGNWPHVITALSFAVTHGVSGAKEGLDRITGASNWATNAAKLVNWPQNACVPRG